MKYHIGFVFALVTIFSFFGYLGFGLTQQDLIFLRAEKTELDTLIGSFQKQHRPEIELNFSALYGAGEQFQVLHPLLQVQNIPLNKNNKACVPTAADADTVDKRDTTISCLDENSIVLADRFLDPHQAKDDVLARYLHANDKLPDDFLSAPPFVDSFGTSYAYLLATQGHGPFNQRFWVQSNLSFFKVSELGEILKKFHIDNVEYWTIAHFNEAETAQIIKGTTALLTKDYLLVRDQSQLGFSPLSYFVYGAQDFRDWLTASKFEAGVDEVGALCLQRTGNICWTYSSKHSLAYLYKYSMFGIGVLFLVFLASLGFYLRHVYQKNQEQKKHRLALQVLSHEFRTPVSSMLLLQNQLDKKYDSLSVDNQDLVTRMGTEIFRLQRIIEVSKTYLQADSHRIHFNEINLPSINSWMEDFVLAENEKIEFQPLAQDMGLQIDAFWLKFVLSSLLQNALAHGAAPIRVRLQRDRKYLRIEVQDSGQCEFKTLDQMTDAFTKSARSQGMGLGLNIVKYVIEQTGGALSFSAAPTTFTITLSPN